jgi:hypothetical protein
MICYGALHFDDNFFFFGDDGKTKRDALRSWVWNVLP